MQRYFIEQLYEELTEENFELFGEETHHMLQVMRMVVGNQIYLVFKDEVAILAEITKIDERRVWVKEIEKEMTDKELPVKVTVACGYPKGDKLDWITQKATELGVHHLIGFPAETSVVRWNQKKLEKRETRLAKIAKEAAEQSHRQQLPTVTLLTNEKELLTILDNYDHVLIAYEEAAKKGEQSQLVTVLAQLEPGETVLIIFGPEGGLTEEEVLLFSQSGGKICALGPRILRTETAPLYFLSSLSYQLELKKADYF